MTIPPIFIHKKFITKHYVSPFDIDIKNRLILFAGTTSFSYSLDTGVFTKIATHTDRVASDLSYDWTSGNWYETIFGRKMILIMNYIYGQVISTTTRSSTTLLRSTGTGAVNSVVLNPKQGLMYYLKSHNSSIMFLTKAWMDGSNVEYLHQTKYISMLTIDVYGNILYFADEVGILSFDLNTNEIERIITLGPRCNVMTLAVHNKTLYFSKFRDSYIIYVHNLDSKGTSVFHQANAEVRHLRVFDSKSQIGNKVFNILVMIL